MLSPVWVISLRLGDLLTRKTLNKTTVASDGRPWPSGPKSTARARSQPQPPGLHPFPSVPGGPPQGPCPRRDPFLPRCPLPEALEAEAGSPLVLHHAPFLPFSCLPFTLWKGRPTFSTCFAGTDRVGHRALVRLDERHLGSWTRKARCGVGWCQPSAPRSVPPEARGPRSAGDTGRAGRGRRGLGYRGTGRFTVSGVSAF